MAEDLKHSELPVEKLRWRCDTEAMPFETTDEVHPCEEIIGQERALDAIRLGLNVNHPGYSIFVTGLVGTGRTTTIKQLLEEMKGEGPPPDDKCYVNNFKNADMPCVLSLPAGEGRAFQARMDQMIRRLQRDIPGVLESENYQERRKELVERVQQQQRSLIEAFEKKAEERGFQLVQVQMGPVVRPGVLPVVDGEPVAIEKLHELVKEGKLPEEKISEIEAKLKELGEEMESLLRKIREIEQKGAEALAKLEKDVIQPIVDESVAAVKDRFSIPKVHEYLDSVHDSIMSDLNRFRGDDEEQKPDEGGRGHGDLFLQYRVNLLVDNSETKGRPIVIETAPNLHRLFGAIERVMDQTGVWRTDFTKIKAGSFHQANGGFLVLNAMDALVEPGVWQTLKRTLRNGILEIQSYDPFYMLATSTIKPEPIDVRVKVVMIGDAELYYLLYHLDTDFKKIFKVKAEFDVNMPLADEAVNQYASFIRKLCDTEELMPFDRSGVARVVEFGVRMAGRRNKLSTRFHVIADLLREANYWAQSEGSEVVKGGHVEKAIHEWIHRVNMVEDKLQEMIDEGLIMIDTEGTKVGQVNALSVFDLGEYMFGKPSRITARTAMGRSGVINIEREADLSGRTHNKGVLILAGYLRGKYAQDKPLTISASLCFEQSYVGVDGDSASSSELYAILSSLAGVPIRQDLAVTGSVNQRGEIQPIGGVNQKIEGFFDVCKARGLTGTQGVLIPHQDVEDLMLRDRVVEAVKEGKFHIYPVRTIDEGMEILTGMKSGVRKEDGTYEENTINYMVDEAISEMADKWKEYAGVEAE
jgi:lon-related putative ATP-dependent protease